MNTLTDTQRYHLILADIAMAAAIRTYDRDYLISSDGETYVPACIRDAWLARTRDEALRRRVTAMASAGVASLQEGTAAQLISAAGTYGVPLTPELAGHIADHFSVRRNAVLTYNR